MHTVSMILSTFYVDVGVLLVWRALLKVTSRPWFQRCLFLVEDSHFDRYFSTVACRRHLETPCRRRAVPREHYTPYVWEPSLEANRLKALHHWHLGFKHEVWAFSSWVGWTWKLVGWTFSGALKKTDLFFSPINIQRLPRNLKLNSQFFRLLENCIFSEDLRRQLFDDTWNPRFWSFYHLSSPDPKEPQNSMIEIILLLMVDLIQGGHRVGWLKCKQCQVWDSWRL